MTKKYFPPLIYVVLARGNSDNARSERSRTQAVASEMGESTKFFEIFHV